MYIKRQTNDMPKSGSHGLTIYQIHGVQSLTRTAKRENEEGGLSGGAIAGIVSAVVLVVLFILLWRYKRPYITQIFYTLKTKLWKTSKNGGTAEKSDPIIPEQLPKPLIWTCLDDTSKTNIQNLHKLSKKNVATTYNNNMLLYHDGIDIHNYNKSGIIIKGLKPGSTFRGFKRLKNTKVLFKTEQDFVKDRTSKNSGKIDRAIKELTDNNLLGKTLTLPNSGLQSKKPEYELKEGDWCFAEQV